MNTIQMLAFLLIVLAEGVVRADTHYVWLDSPGSSPPFTSWATAAHTIQEAVDEAVDGDTVLVTNGTYILSSQIGITNGITVQSVNGSEATVVDGNYPITTNRCFRLSHSDAVVDGFTITKGCDFDAGGGIYLDGGGTIQNCMIVGNTTEEEGGDGGGVYCNHGGIIRDCTITANYADEDGSGICCNYGGLIQNCTITFNDSDWAGGGVFCYYGGLIESCVIANNNAGEYGGGLYFRGDGGLAQNCIIVGNHASEEGGGVSLSYGSFSYGVLLNCTIVENTAQQGGGLKTSYQMTKIINCIVSLNEASWRGDNWMDDDGEEADLVNCYINGDPQLTPTGYLKETSPCIDAGADLADIMIDLDGVPRPLDGNNDGLAKWDIGCYEFVHPLADTDGDEMPDQWELDKQLDPLTSDGSSDPDADLMSNLAEYISDTDPRNAESVLALTGISEQMGGTRIDWKGGCDVIQYLEATDSLFATNWIPIYALPPPTPPNNAVIVFGETNRTQFYRIRAER